MVVTCPVITVVIPTYNRSQLLAKAVSSVRLQTYTSWEIIVVDNFSEDDTDRVISEFSNYNIKLIKIHNQGVVAKSRNFGIRQAKGQYIAFLDSDDIWYPEKLEKTLKVLNEGADFVYHNLDAISDSGLKIGEINYSRQVTHPVFDDLIRSGNCILNSSVVVRRSLLEQVGYLSEDRDLVAIEDYDAWLKIARLTNKYVYLPQSLGGYCMESEDKLSSATRTLKTLDAIKHKYASEFSDRSKAAWIYRSKLCAYLQSSKYLEALKIIALNLSFSLILGIATSFTKRLFARS